MAQFALISETIYAAAWNLDHSVPRGSVRTQEKLWNFVHLAKPASTGCGLLRELRNPNSMQIMPTNFKAGWRDASQEDPLKNYPLMVSSARLSFHHQRNHLDKSGKKRKLDAEGYHDALSRPDQCHRRFVCRQTLGLVAPANPHFLLKALLQLTIHNLLCLGSL